MPFTPNHQKKVNECYPKNETESAVSGKLSTLIYYINARPQKLVKVATYLATKIQRDIYKQPDGYNIVTLEIIESIMKNCQIYFETFCPYVLDILKELFLNTSSYNLTVRAMSTLTEFSARSKNLIGSIHDEHFFVNLSELTRFFSRLSKYGKERDINSDEWIKIGFQGLVLLVSIEDFKAENCIQRNLVVVDTIWYSIKSLTSSLLETVDKSSGAGDLSNIPIFGQKSIALLRSLIENSGAIGLPVVLNNIIETCDREGWEPKTLSSFVWGSIALGAPSQYLFLVISTIFKTLDSTDFIEARHVACMFCVHQILIHNRSPLGFSSIEMARNILKQLRLLTAKIPLDLPPVLQPITSHNLPEPFLVALLSLLAVLQNNSFVTQKFDVLSYCLRKSFQGTSEAPYYLISEKDSASFDKLSFTTETWDESGNYLAFSRVIWIALQTAIIEQPKNVKFSFIQSPIKFFEKLLNVLILNDSEIKLNSLSLISSMLSKGLIFTKESNRKDHIETLLDFTLSKFYQCLQTTSSDMLHFILIYRIIRDIDSENPIAFAKSISMLSTLGGHFKINDPKKSSWCMLMLILLTTKSTQFVSVDSHRLQELENIKSINSEFVSLFEEREIDFLMDSSRFAKLNVHEIEVEDMFTKSDLFDEGIRTTVIAKFKPVEIISLKDDGSKLQSQSRSLQSFRDSFRDNKPRKEGMSSRRSFLSLNLGSQESSNTSGFHSIKSTGALKEPLSDPFSPQSRSVSPENLSSPSVSYLAADFETLSVQNRGKLKSGKSGRESLLE